MSSTPSKIPKVTSIDMKNANLWLGYIEQCSSNKGEDLEITIPVSMSEIREIMFAVAYNPVAGFTVEPQSESVVIPAKSMGINHKYKPINAKANIYISTLDGSSTKIKFIKYNQSFYTCGKVAWR